jgi:putative FmdB family regulatory protein
MPIYEYECEKCGHRLEKIQKFSDPLLETCPACGGALHKMQSAPAFQFRGTGWYVTDYAKSGKPDTKETKSTPESAKSESAKSEPAKSDAVPSAPAKTETKSGD